MVQAARQIADTVEDPFEFWNKWLDCAVAHPDAQARLVDLARALQKQEGGTVDEQNHWRDLPRLGWSLRESFEIYDNPDKADEFVHLCRMYALCAKEGLADTVAYAVIVFRAALEQESTPKDNDFRIRALTVWVQMAGKQLYNQGNAHHESTPMCQCGSRWKGGSGLNKERWSFWKDQLKMVSSEHCTALLQAMDTAERD